MKNRNYPHISDTKFPDLSTVDAYKYKQEFDYKRYEISTTAHLCRVPWRPDYADVVYFEDEARRDAYFNALFADSSESVNLPSMFRVYDADSLKIELPIDVALKYNYLVVDYNLVTSEGEPVIGETPDGFRRMFYFVTDMKQESVNTTQLRLVADYWMTYINSVDIEYMELLRGHAPVASTSVESYLSNPLANSEMLLASDVNFGELQNARSEEHIILNDGPELLVIATTGNTGTTRHPWAWDGKMNTEVMYNSQTLSNVQVISTPVENWQDFADYVTNNYPQFFESVKAMFIIPEKIIEYAGDAFEFMGVSWRFLKDQSSFTAGEFSITKDKFNFDPKFSDLAKLYTYPYSAIIGEDFRGNKTVIRIEETVGRLQLHGIINYTFPFLNIQGYHTGIGSDVSSVINFKTSIDNKYTIGGRDYDFNVKWGIPTMALQLTAEADWELNGKIGADCSKANAYASAECAKSNTYASAATAKDNAYASAATAKDNAYASAATAKDNGNASAETARDNAKDSNETTKTNGFKAANKNKQLTKDGNNVSLGKVNLQNLINDKIFERNQKTATTDNGYTSDLNQALQAYAAGASRATQAKSAEEATKTAQLGILSASISAEGDFMRNYLQSSVSTVSGMASSAISGEEKNVAGSFVSGLGGHLNTIVAGLTNGVTAGLNGLVSLASTAITNNLESDKVEAQIEASQASVDATNKNSTDRLVNRQNAETNNYSDSRNLATNLNTLDYNFSNRCADESTAVTKNNLKRTYDTVNNNADRSYGTSTGNNERSKTTSEGNADRTKTTSEGNADRTKTTSESNADRTCTTTEANADRSWDASHNQKLLNAHPEFGNRSGDGDLVVKPMGIRYNIITQSNGAIRQAGEQFLRYGYNLGMQWDFGSFNVMPKFSYWQCGQVCVFGDVYNGALDAIKSILQNGMTVWRKPDELGRVSIYDNK